VFDGNYKQIAYLVKCAEEIFGWKCVY